MSPLCGIPEVPPSIASPMKTMLDEVARFRKHVDNIKGGENLAGVDKKQLKQAIAMATVLLALCFPTNRKHTCMVA